jgi:hypothetical protein
MIVYDTPSCPVCDLYQAYTRVETEKTALADELFTLMDLVKQYSPELLT